MRSPWRMPMLALGLTLASAGLVLGLFLGPTAWSAIPSVGGAAMLLVGVGSLLRESREARVPPADVRPVPTPSAATLAELAEPITSCARCGSLEVLPVILAVQGHEVSCPRCGHLGEPVHFLRRADYRAYVVELRGR